MPPALPNQAAGLYRLCNAILPSGREKRATECITTALLLAAFYISFQRLAHEVPPPALSFHLGCPTITPHPSLPVRDHRSARARGSAGITMPARPSASWAGALDRSQG